MSNHSSHLPCRASRLALRFLLISAVVVACALHLSAQAAPDAGGRGRILLVLPFGNDTGNPNLEWIREAAPEILNSRLISVGFAPLSRADRLYALDHLGLPPGFQPSRASSLKLAQTIDADAIIVGSYKTDGDHFTAEARIVDVPHLRMGPPLAAEGAMPNLISIFDTLAWKITRQLDPSFSGPVDTFIAAGKNLSLAGFEQYIRGITEPDQAERMRHLKEAVKISPDFSKAWMALGREQYADQQYEEAATAFAKVSGNDADSLEAGFYRGLALMFSGNYAKAESAFAAVARVLPLAPVLNNEGVAISRQGHDGTALFRQAVAADPATADYHFNLAVSLQRHGDHAGAVREIAQSLKLRPNDSEAQTVEAAWKQPSSASSVDPLERIARGFDAVAFRQAAVMLDQMEATRLAALSPAQRARAFTVKAVDYLSRGLLLEAERLFHDAVTADPNSPEPHLGLAQVRERTGDAVGAREQAEAALRIQPSAEAYMVLARLDLKANHLDVASREAGEALKLSPNDKRAQELMHEITARQGAPK